MGWMTIVLGVPLAVFSGVGGRAYDRDGDGVAELVPARTVVADLNRDGVFEQLRYEGNLLTMVRDPLAEGKVIEFPELITDLSIRDTDHDGRADITITLTSGATMQLNRRALLSEASNPAMRRGSRPLQGRGFVGGGSGGGARLRRACHRLL